jgi:hypothetical protein
VTEDALVSNCKIINHGLDPALAPTISFRNDLDEESKESRQKPVSIDQYSKEENCRATEVISRINTRVEQLEHLAI